MNASLTSLFAAGARAIERSEIRELLKLVDRPDLISFAGGVPDPELFPLDLLNAAFTEIARHPDIAKKGFQYSVTEGYLPLRAWIGGYLRQKGQRVGTDEVLITSGSQQALDLLARLFLEPGDRVVMTRPTYLGALQVFSLHRPSFIGVPCDESGFLLEPLEQELKKGAKLIYVVPDFCNPTGITHSLERRKGLLKLASRTGTPIIEDIAYEHLRFEGEGVPTLAALAAEAERTGEFASTPVIQVGTFSKSVCPGLRLGRTTASTEIIERLITIKQATDLHTGTLMQIAMADVAPLFFADGVPNMVAIYRRRRDAMLGALATYFPESAAWTRPQGGFFVWVTLPEDFDCERLFNQSVKEYSVAFVPGRAFFPNGGGANTMRLSFSLNSEDRIVEGARRLGAAIAETVRGG